MNRLEEVPLKKFVKVVDLLDSIKGSDLSIEIDYLESFLDSMEYGGMIHAYLCYVNPSKKQEYASHYSQLWNQGKGTSYWWRRDSLEYNIFYQSLGLLENEQELGQISFRLINSYAVCFNSEVYPDHGEETSANIVDDLNNENYKIDWYDRSWGEEGAAGGIISLAINPILASKLYLLKRYDVDKQLLLDLENIRLSKKMLNFKELNFAYQSLNNEQKLKFAKRLIEEQRNIIIDVKEYGVPVLRTKNVKDTIPFHIAAKTYGFSDSIGYVYVDKNDECFILLWHPLSKLDMAEKHDSAIQAGSKPFFYSLYNQCLDTIIVRYPFDIILNKEQQLLFVEMESFYDNKLEEVDMLINRLSHLKSMCSASKHEDFVYERFRNTGNPIYSLQLVNQMGECSYGWLAVTMDDYGGLRYCTFQSYYSEESDSIELSSVSCQ